MISDGEKKIHLVMRFSDNNLVEKSTINEHQKIISNFGAVWIGKFGRPLSAKPIERINTQCRDGFPTYLYLVRKIKEKYEAFKGTIIKSSQNLPIQEKNLVPEYYRDERSIYNIKFWLKLSEIKPIKSEELDNLHITTTKSPIPYVLRRSSIALFIVSEGKGIRI